MEQERHNIEELFVEFCEWLIDFPVKDIEKLREGDEIYGAIEFYNDNISAGGGGGGGVEAGTHSTPKYILSTVEYTCPSLFVGIRLNPWIFFGSSYDVLLVCLCSYTDYKYKRLYSLFISQKMEADRKKDCIVKKMKKSFHIQIVELYKYVAEDGFIEHRAIVKTHWLRIIQRHWRKVVAERRRILLVRGSLKEQWRRETCGEYSAGVRSWPGIRGMLACYV